MRRGAIAILFVRHLLAIAVLPVTVTIVVPLWIKRRSGVPFGFGHGPSALALQLAGAAVLTLGLVLFTASLRRFATEGRGTLAPWDPPRVLVVRGPYRWVRNPMISGVIFILFGEAFMLRSLAHLGWAAAFLAINLIYIPLLEEPQLEDRFGESYRHYCRHVPRVFPRLRPWTARPSPDGDGSRDATR
jgi:protein-S-isoprenylcysteine O-methyltransferase Ste14